MAKSLKNCNFQPMCPFILSIAYRLPLIYFVSAHHSVPLPTFPAQLNLSDLYILVRIKVYTSFNSVPVIAESAKVLENALYYYPVPLTYSSH